MHNLVAALLAGFVAVSAQTPVPKGFENVQGTWVVTGAPGGPVPAGMHAAFVVTGDKYQGFENGKSDERGTITLGTAAKPVTIDLAISEGSSAGKTKLGLLEVDQDTVRLALAEPGATVRPTAFDGTNTLTLTRARPLAKDLEGTWEGSVTLGANTLRLVLKLANGADGLGGGVLISPDQSAKEIPIAAALQMGSRVRAIIPTIRATIDGEVKDGQITGTLQQGPSTTPIVLKRS